MQSIDRKPFQGVLNVVKFNWQFYVIGFVSVVALTLVRPYVHGYWQNVAVVLSAVVVLAVIVSVLSTFYAYDHSDFYSLNWLPLGIKKDARVINIHAGFDETSEIISKKFGLVDLSVLDFYDQKKHTEISIKRARNQGAVFAGTRTTSTEKIELDANSADYIFLILAAHEIRNEHERIGFFKQLGVALRNNGRIIVAEHLRNTPNFVAYNIGFFHFFSRTAWRRTFALAGISLISELRINPFITAFILEKDGATT